MAAWDFTPKPERRARRDFTKSEAEEFIDYCPGSGAFRWKVKVMCFAGGKSPGDEAGTIIGDGYRAITLYGRQYRAHHLAWLFMTGTWPPFGVDIDHENRDRADNRWDNLRLATRGQNNVNTEMRRASKSGHRGVHQNRDKGWYARISVDKRVVHLGCFDNLEDAIAARRRAEIEHYKQFT